MAYSTRLERSGSHEWWLHEWLQEFSQHEKVVSLQKSDPSRKNVWCSRTSAVPRWNADERRVRHAAATARDRRRAGRPVRLPSSGGMVRS